ncbi:hypothetical protein GCM10010493_81030 [Streptomyces lavendulae subsp. grasserius]
MPITKSPPEFIFTDFRADQIAVSRTQPVKLRWVCDGDADATFTLFWSGNTGGESLAKGTREWPPSGQSRMITKDTSFMLRANTKNPSGGNEYHYQTIVINCTDPDLTANTLDVTNDTHLNTLTNTGRIHALAGIQGDGTKPLRVHQPAGLKVDAALDVGEYEGQATFRRQVTVAGTTALNGTTNLKTTNVAADSTFTANGTSNLNGTTNLKTTNVAAGSTFTAHGNFTASGGISLSEATSIFREPVSIPGAGHFTADADGFIYGQNRSGTTFYVLVRQGWTGPERRRVTVRDWESYCIPVKRNQVIDFENETAAIRNDSFWMRIS